MPKTYERTAVRTGMTRVKEERMPFGWSVNPYRGCAHGCGFCFARGFQGFMDRGAGDEFQDNLLIKSNVAEALESQLGALAARFRYDIDEVGRHVGQVMVGTVTDPYQQLEAREGLTRECLKVLAKYRVPVSVTTRSPLIVRDLDVLKQMSGLTVHFSVNTLDDNLARKLEPGAPPPSKRLEAMAVLTEKGIRCSMFIAPVLPLLSDDEGTLEALFEAAVCTTGSPPSMISALRLSPEVKKWYFGVLSQHYPEKVEPYRRLYAGGGYADDRYRERLNGVIGRLREQYAISGEEGVVRAEARTGAADASGVRRLAEDAESLRARLGADKAGSAIGGVVEQLSLF